MTDCLVCGNLVEESRYQSPYFYDFCNGCYGSFCRRVQRHSQRARKVGTYTKLSPSEVISLIREQNFACKHCKKITKLSGEGSENYLSIDHDYPLHCGGINHISNVIILCRRCHDKKDNAKQNQSSPWKKKKVSAFGTFANLFMEAGLILEEKQEEYR